MELTNRQQLGLLAVSAFAVGVQLHVVVSG